MMAITKSRKLDRLRACEIVLVKHGKQWVAVGEALMEIRDDDLYLEDGYTSWPKYLAEHEAVFGIGSERQANTYIAAARVMPALPQPSAPSAGSQWSIKHAAQFDRLATTGAAKKVANTLLQNGKPPKVSVVKKAVDKVLGIKPKKKKKPRPPEPPMLDAVVQRWTDELRAIAVVLDSISKSDLKLFRESEPLIVKDLVRSVKRVDKSLERLWAALPD